MSGQAAKERAEAYRTALQELTLFRSRTSAALLQVRSAVSLFWPQSNIGQALLPTAVLPTLTIGRLNSTGRVAQIFTP